ncbi:MAG: ABC transporter ATP-binding protein [Turicibacter sp.]|nr:ABC transporter ATP-binding protein [Turicibacter sp.]
MVNTIVSIENLVKRYKDLIAVDNFSLHVNEGEVLGLLGPNGSGKTTTINCLLALVTKDNGDINVFGKKMSQNAYDIKRDIGVVLQNVAVFEELTVYENIDYFCGLYIKDNATRKRYVQEAIDFVQLNDQVKMVPKKLSGGLLRRLNIACGIAHKPKLIILDEPTVAVDPQSREYILDGIKKLNEQGATIIYTSHYMEEIEQLCSRIVIMDAGKKIAEGTKQELKRMIKTGETVKIEILNLDEEHLNGLRRIETVTSVKYRDELLEIKCEQGTNNLMLVMRYLDEHNIPAGRILSELPTLNDVFLEMTGKELRD